MDELGCKEELGCKRGSGWCRQVGEGEGPAKRGVTAGPSFAVGEVRSAELSDHILVPGCHHLGGVSCVRDLLPVMKCGNFLNEFK